MKLLKKNLLKKAVDDLFTILIATYGLRNLDKISKDLRKKVIEENKRR